LYVPGLGSGRYAIGPYKYLTRVSGILLASCILESSPVLGWIDQLPAVALMALAVPAVVHAE